MYTIYEQMLSERQRIEEHARLIQGQIDKLPDGKLVCGRNGKHIKCYRSDGHNQVYISQKNKKLIEQLAAKKYLSRKLKDLRQEQKAIDFYLRHHAADHECAEQLLADSSSYARFLTPYFAPLSKELLDWMNSPYEHNPMNPEQLMHKTTSGQYVRSKSEAMIAMLLHLNKIPFRYECALRLEESTFYPDFTIRHPRTGKLYYWEHFGLMDQPLYCKNTFSKLQLYTSNNIIPTIHLITTFETKDNPLSLGTIDNLIQQYFLKG